MHIQAPEGYAAMVQGASDAPGTDIISRHVGTYAVFVIDGPLTGRSVADGLRAEARHLLDRGEKNLILDLSGVPITDSTGIGVLVAVRKLVQEAQGKLVLFIVEPRLLETLKRMRLDSLFTFTDDPTFTFAKQ
jgi:anti-anti-sigma factor